MDKDFSFLDMAKRQDPSLEPDSKGRTLRRIPKTDVLVLSLRPKTDIKPKFIFYNAVTAINYLSKTRGIFLRPTYDQFRVSWVEIRISLSYLALYDI
jgi:hypothetical protein